MDKIKYYLAPLEGVTGYIYRNAFHDFFGGQTDKYFLPFIAPHTKRSFNAKEKNDLMQKHNKGMHAVPQILTKSAEDFLKIEADLREQYDYTELNINLGCPSGTVAAKARGAGFLAKPKELDEFLQEIFAKKTGEVSLKTRIGMYEPEEFYGLLEIYNKYPLKELIIHPRVREEYYRGEPHYDMYQYAVEHSTNPVCYNGNIFSVRDYEERKQQLSLDDATASGALMLGRGVMANPGLIRELATGKRMTKEEFASFHDRILSDYSQVLSGDQTVLFKMKELWAYMIYLFPDHETYEKKIRKASHITEYKTAVARLLDERDIAADAAYLK